MAQIKIDAVIVTYNRLQKLKQALDCYDKQTIAFRNVIVVNNHCTDGTDVYLEDWKNQSSKYGRYVLTMSENLGGSGGFYQGEKFAMTLNPDWVFIADDDAYPMPDMVKEACVFMQSHTDEKISAICSKVVVPDGSILLGCRSHLCVDENKLTIEKATEEEYTRSYFVHNVLSYVGAFISTSALQENGLVNPDYFIYQDDVEHSIRLSKYGNMYCVPSSVIVHDDIRNLKPVDINLSLWKQYYAYRNRYDLLRRHYPSLAKKYKHELYNSFNAHRDKSISADRKMCLEAIKDAEKGILGIHPIYRPGLDISKTKLPYPRLHWLFVYYLRRIKKILKT